MLIKIRSDESIKIWLICLAIKRNVAITCDIFGKNLFRNRYSLTPRSIIDPSFPVHQLDTRKQIIRLKSTWISKFNNQLGEFRVAFPRDFDHSTWFPSLKIAIPVTFDETLDNGNTGYK